MKLKLLLSLLVLCFSHLSAQQKSLTDEQIESSIKKGMSEQPQQVGLHLSDSLAMFGAVASGGKSSYGFSLTLYTPTTWVEWQAAEAHHLMKPFTPGDVTEDMRADVIRVLVRASTPGKVTASAMNTASSVDHVVMQDAKKTVIIQPIHEEPTDQMVASAVSSQFTFHGEVAEFSMDAINQLRGPNGDGEFSITVIGPHEKKEFKVKAKHFARL